MKKIAQKLWQFKLPLGLLILIAFAAMLGPFLPIKVQSFFYSVSVSLKDILVLLLPILIFLLIISSILRLRTGAATLILILIPMLCCSNFITTWIAYLAGNGVIDRANLHIISGLTDNDLPLMWTMQLPSLIDNRLAMITALICGLVTNFMVPNKSTIIAERTSKIAHYFLLKFFIPVMPLMIFGFVIKMQYDDILSELVTHYAFIFIAVCCVQIAYVAFLYLLANNFRLGLAWNALKNMFPAIITGFSTMSSAAAIPYMLVGTRENIKDEQVTNFVVPGTVNFHLIGDCIAIPVFALAIMTSFGFDIPNPGAYLVFSLYFVLAKFGVAAVPGAGILVMWPILGSQLGFSAEMLTLIHALYVMFDPIITATNIMGNGAFAMLFKKVYNLANKTR